MDNKKNQTQQNDLNNQGQTETTTKDTKQSSKSMRGSTQQADQRNSKRQTMSEDNNAAMNRNELDEDGQDKDM